MDSSPHGQLAPGHLVPWTAPQRQITPWLIAWSTNLFINLHQRIDMIISHGQLALWVVSWSENYGAKCLRAKCHRVSFHGESCPWVGQLIYL
jgi:hypothetical protein